MFRRTAPRDVLDVAILCISTNGGRWGGDERGALLIPLEGCSCEQQPTMVQSSRFVVYCGFILLAAQSSQHLS
jgi:hypothetical protein